ncbi:hypothetical protein SLE2022_095480 [Rubroshorea leprosula]
MDSPSMRSVVLAFTDNPTVLVSGVLRASRELGIGQQEPQTINQASPSGELPLDSTSVDNVIAVCGSEFSNDKLSEEIYRVLKPGGTVIIFKNLQSGIGETDKAVSALERKLLLAGFSEGQRLQLESSAEVDQIFGVKAKKPSWKIGSAFAIKKAPKSSLKLQIDEDSDLIDEDSLLTEEDLKKPQLPTVGDCEVGSTRKACKSCTCGRAEAEEKGQKLELTMDQINNPQSACGNCGLGDAFRCGTCPYKGLPPFKLGEKVSLPGNFLAADI